MGSAPTKSTVNCTDKGQSSADGLSVVAIVRVIQDLAYPFLESAGAQFGHIDAGCDLRDPGAVIRPTCADESAIGGMRATGTDTVPDFANCRRRR